MSNSKDFHNLNCFRYLQQIQQQVDKDGLRAFLAPLLSQEEVKIFVDMDNYHEQYSYANLYHKFLSRLEQAIDSPQSFSTNIAQFTNYNQIIHLVYANNNHNLAETFAHFKAGLSTRRLYESRPESLVAKELEKLGPKISHHHSPQQARKTINRGMTIIAANFKPMLTTSLPTVRAYHHSQAIIRGQELRFGTQAQRHQGKARLSPLFQAWIDRPEANHVYFNLLGFDRSSFIGKKEKQLSEVLHAAEKDGKFYVLTLPADQGLIDKNDYKKQNPKIAKARAMQEMLAIAMGESENKIKDFVVSERVKAKLYPDANEAAKLIELLNKSFTSLGFSDKDELSPAERQAVWFYFCKFEFPDFVLEQLKPSTWNASCKDAIDRGGVASAFYHLMKSFSHDVSMSREEFEQGLHAAAGMVKARGLNHHYEIIWNAVLHYVNAHFDQLSQNPQQSWLIHWRNDNTPKAIAEDLDYVLKIADQNRIILERQGALHQAAIAIIDEVKGLVLRGNINKKDLPLALELISHTSQLAINPLQLKQDLPAMIADLGERPIFANVLERFKHWLLSLLAIKSKRPTQLRLHLSLFKNELELSQKHLLDPVEGTNKSSKPPKNP